VKAPSAITEATATVTMVARPAMKFLIFVDMFDFLTPVGTSLLIAKSAEPASFASYHWDNELASSLNCSLICVGALERKDESKS
jgi:hypothetical protein